MSIAKRQSQMLPKSRLNAQDQESDNDSKKQLTTNERKPETRSCSTFSSSKAGGRVPNLSRLEKHPLPKQRKLKEPAILNARSQPRKIGAVAAPLKVKGNVVNKPAQLGKVNQDTASVSHNRGLIPNRGKPYTKEQIQERLKKKSPWFDSIVSPITGGGVKIPDPIGTETGTYQHIENVSVAVNVNGVAGLRVVCPYINSFANLSFPDGLNYQTTRAASSISNLDWGQVGGSNNTGNSFKQVPALMKANARTHRVVSASVLAQAEVSTLNDAGEMCAFVTPFAINIRTTPYSTYQFQYDSSLIPVNAHKPVVARWYPLSAEANLFEGDLFLPNADIIVSYQDFLDPKDVGHDETPGVIPWEFGVVCTGMTPSSGVVRFQIVVNYEFIPLMTTAMVSAAPSPIDEVEETLVNTWVADMPVTEVVSQKFASQAQQVSRVSEESEPSGFGMLFNVIEEALPLVKMFL